LPTKAKANKYHYYLVFKVKSKVTQSEQFKVLANLAEKYPTLIQGSGVSRYAKVVDIHLFCTAAECRKVLNYIKKTWGTPTVYKYSEDEYEKPD